MKETTKGKFKRREHRDRIERILVFVLFVFFAANSAFSQIQQAWVARYNNGMTNGRHQATKMVLDATGNIYVAGFSQNTNGNYGYATIKHTPNGTKLWAIRYDSTNTPDARPSGLVLDNGNSVIVTGTAITVKYGKRQEGCILYTGAGAAVEWGDETQCQWTSSFYPARNRKLDFALPSQRSGVGRFCGATRISEEPIALLGLR